MNNGIIVKILRDVVSNAPRINQETVDNVKSIISHLEEENKVEEVPLVDIDNQVEAENLVNSINEEIKKPEFTINLQEFGVKKNKGGRPKKRK